MKKRLFGAFLWFYTGWYAGTILAWTTHAAVNLGPALGFLAATTFLTFRELKAGQTSKA